MYVSLKQEQILKEQSGKAIREMKAGKAAGPSEVSVEMMVELSQGELDGVGAECCGTDFLGARGCFVLRGV